jgi:hypothetical protein
MTHWRTTLVGILTGCTYAALNAYQGGMKLSQWAMAAGIAILGFLAADAKNATSK